MTMLAIVAGQVSCLPVASLREAWSNARQSSLVSGLGLSAKLTNCRYAESWSPVNCHHLPLRTAVWRLPRAVAKDQDTPDDIPQELLEDSKFARIQNDDACFGPPALLLLGFNAEDIYKVNKLMGEIDGEFMKVLLCTEQMLSYPLGMAIYADQSDIGKLKPADALPRICFISGLTGEEMMMLIQAFPQAGIEKPIFAGHVLNNTKKLLAELIEEILGDHERLSRERLRVQA
eukprot:TRINITY_DN9458_c0_g2_i1.p1 TRINITY_DN9458_c0_g2~~TRINITY_DN9458_c0_g2_i1.p1  ORF type:complete len:232 (-),score=32.94 TRINITY_DN9458_c0_g2_i1:386-1081(-)